MPTKLFKITDNGMLREVDPDKHKDEPRKHMSMDGIDILLSDEEIAEIKKQEEIFKQENDIITKNLDEVAKTKKEAIDKLCKLGLTQEEINSLIK